MQKINLKMNINTKSEKGITLVSLVITIIVILILTVGVTTSINTSKQVEYKNYKKMCADVELLEDKVLLYYNTYEELPVKETEVTDIPDELNSEHKYYEIDTSKLKNITLNFGSDTDIYIVDSETYQVYYLEGIQYDDVTYYTN